MISSRYWKLRNRSPHSGDLIKRAIARHLVDRRNPAAWLAAGTGRVI